MAEHKYANTAAAVMLAEGLRSAACERNLSLREIGRRLGYRQPVVLSHMSSGRVPVPITRAVAIAEQVGIPRDDFLETVLTQHYPQIEWGSITGTVDPAIRDVEAAAGKPISALSAAHQRILREVAVDQKPEERWLGVEEVAAVRLMRDLFPNMSKGGLSEDDRDALRLAVELKNARDAEGPDSPLGKGDNDAI